jgi:hypothetical protein
MKSGGLGKQWLDRILLCAISEKHSHGPCLCEILCPRGNKLKLDTFVRETNERRQRTISLGGLRLDDI